QRPSPRARWGSRAWGASALGVAAVLLLGLALRQLTQAPEVARAPAYRGALRPEAGARFVRLGAAPDEVVRLFQGTVHFEVAHLGDGERFRVITHDGEVEVRGTVFEVTASEDRLESVRVTRGRVVVRHEAQDAVELEAGERWSKPRVELVPPGPDLAPAPAEPVAEPPHSRSSPRIRRTHTRSSSASTEVVEAATSSPTVAHGRPAPSRAELWYQEGWSALRAGDYARAVSAFEAVSATPGSPFEVDAAYWRAVSLGRAGRSAEASEALSEYLARYPESARAAEGQAMLGWLLLERGQLSAARVAFEAALGSGVPRAEQSARRGLSALGASPGPAVEKP
ncbi:MAG: tetratricopeptide repeat protein, partial [Myxococcales bacterium]|nr:tetratricopeptide repeat protein [Myxococcales bacterium]